ncbi:Hypothetical predicted protein [Paramuricea clavata]|uniref:Uncharacterized protein n=1 Tax=Paramuricea clavata TaxID=317549 RepID=A0A6S7H443_PARCT|nr:Hypothetical predicted protein [Paramuricea clavata]
MPIADKVFMQRNCIEEHLIELNNGNDVYLWEATVAEIIHHLKVKIITTRKSTLRTIAKQKEDQDGNDVFNLDEIPMAKPKPRTLHDSLPRYQGRKRKITPLPPLQTGTRVAIRSRVDFDWSLLGTIAEIKPNRTYIVLTDQGSTLTRNRRYLRPASSPAGNNTSEANDEQNPNPTTNPLGGRHVGLRDPYNLRKRCPKN